MAKRKIFYGWWIVLACAVLNFFAGGVFVYGFTMFFNPIRETFGWTAAVTSLAFAFKGVEQGVMSPIAGFLVDKFGPRKLMLLGWTISGLGFLWISRIGSLWAFYASFVVIAFGMSLASFVSVNTAIANWFVKKRSRAMTFAYIGYGASGALAPLLELGISQLGWRTTLTIVAIASFVICVPLSLLIRHKPSQYGLLPDGEAKVMNQPEIAANSHSSGKTLKQESGSREFTAQAALKTPAFWLLSLVLLAQSLGYSAISVHTMPFLETVKIPAAVAASVVTGITLCSLIGRLGFGFLGDFVDKRRLIAASLALQAVGTLIFSYIGAGAIWLIIPFLLTYAPGFGGIMPVRPALQADFFGIRSYGTIMGLMSVVSVIAGIVSPVFAGWILDTTGSYQLAWWIFALLTVPGIPLVLLAKPPKVKQIS
jgi:MFS family permease